MSATRLRERATKTHYFACPCIGAIETKMDSAHPKNGEQYSKCPAEVCKISHSSKPSADRKSDRIRRRISAGCLPPEALQQHRLGPPEPNLREIAGSGGFRPRQLFSQRADQHQHDKMTIPAIFPVVRCRGSGELLNGMYVVLYKSLWTSSKYPNKALTSITVVSQ